MQKYSFVKFHQFYSAKLYLKGYAEDSRTTFSPAGDNKISQKQENGKKVFRIFFQNFFEVPDHSHSAENPKGSSILEKKSFVVKMRVGFEKNEFEKKSHG